MRVILLLVLFLSSHLTVFAKEPVYFDYSSNNVSHENTINTTFRYELGDIPLDRFKVRPIADSARVLILGNDLWIDSVSSWTMLPNLSDTIEIKFAGDFFDTNLHFEVLDTVTGIVYKTPVHRVISRSWFINYLGRLNENIMKW
jgi:hypothetical protein